ncbi:hypothetical protein CK500_15660 [Halorubrum salipaludis]|uniref:Uncharacterized protein n=1 Tax=Halorubrum salipaludis TaxID=2032630 RepID=A0A2A2F4C6_9EURY|nr:hypothetical protein [Halorubrum salipaludis]PAU80296.1 hypothetical protein CK500_15660 [Halorubrum salipaludis]
MNTGPTGLWTWTQRFTVASVGSFVGSLLALLGGANKVAVLIGVFGFVCPMVFGMAYLLLPSYVGKTLVDQRLAGIHFGLAYVGVSLLVADQFVTARILLRPLGVTLWTTGVLIFVGSLLATVGPAAVGTVAGTLGGSGRSQRSTRLATAMIPVAVCYLLVGTVALLMTVAPLGIGTVTVAQVTHYYLTGFATLLIYALGMRLLTAFFHVSLPRPVVWIVLVAGALAPAFLGTFLWIDPWFRVGGVFATLAMLGYAALVLFVILKTNRRRVGVSGIALGAIAGGTAVVSVVPVAFGFGDPISLAVHRTLILAGFFPLTIVGYAYLFFPITGGQFTGANPRAARVTIALLGAGVAVQSVGVALQYEPVRVIGILGSVIGAIGCGYLLGCRFVNG